MHSALLLFPGCTGTDRPRLTVPVSLRVRLFCDYKYYVPAQCRICNYHLTSNSWDLLGDFTQNPIQTFSSSHIEEFASLLQQNMYAHLDFQNKDEIPEHIMH